MPFKTMQEAFDEGHDQDVEAFLKADAESQGVPWHVYCYDNGIIGKAQTNRINRHEVQYDPNFLTNERTAEKEEKNES